MFMPVAATTSIPANQPSRAGRLLDIVRRLIDYGKKLASTLSERSDGTDLTDVTRWFGTYDIALILARITRGLHLANVLEARVLESAARLDAPPKPPRAASARAQSASAPRRHEAPPADSRLAYLPAAEQIAAEVRRRPIGAVIADICRDLGIMPCHPLWPELQCLIRDNGGNVARLLKDIFDRVERFFIPDVAGLTSPATTPPRQPQASTGPP